MMRHRRYESLIVLQLYGEITADERTDLEKHLASCLRCGDFRKKVAGVFSERKPQSGVPAEETLLAARDEFHRALSSEMEKKRGSQKVLKFSQHPRWSGIGVPIYATAAVAFLMFAAGVVSGYFFFDRGTRGGSGIQAVLSEISSGMPDDAAITDVRFMKTDKKSGEVQFSFDLIRRYEMVGSLDDQHVQKILAYALVNSDNPGVRLRTIGMLDASARPDKEIVDALVNAVKTDNNVGVRREALLSLEKFPFDNQTKETLLFVLQHDKNPGMRVAAINFLATKELNVTSGAGEEKHPDPRVLDVLKERSESDPNGYVRLKAADMLKEFKEL